MELPKQACPIIRSMNQTQPSVANSGVIASAVSDCYGLPYLAQQMCLLGHVT